MPLLPVLRSRSAPQKALGQRIRSLTGLRIRQLDLYELAFTHPSVHGLKTLSFHSTNQRLEFLGDAVLDLVVAEFLFRKFPFKQEGFLTDMRSKVVNGEFLDQLGRKLGLDEMLCETSLRLYEGLGDGRTPHHLLKQLKSKGSVADAFEAFVGALYLDRGLTDTRSWLENRILEPQVDWEELALSGSNPKSRLLEWAQKHRAQYRMDCQEIESGKGPNKTMLYKITLWVNGKEVAHAESPSKRKAEQAAAAQFFEQREQSELL
ncbi:MAG: ribonuclease III family protein [Bacteroidetes bacterium]|nr:ribonuclease III family protein [Bacteroidota bacterium]